MWNWRDAPKVGIILIALGAVVLAFMGGDVPDRSGLIEVSRQLRSLEKVTGKGGGLSTIRFALTTDPRHFQYQSKGGRIADVWSALEKADRSELSVLIDPASSHSPPLDGRDFYTAFEIKVGAKTIRPYAEVAESWRSDNDVGVWLGYGAAITGAALLVAHFWRRRRV